MNSSFADNYLRTGRLQFDYYKSLGEKTIAQLRDEDLLWQPNESSNSIAFIMRHLAGNMNARWTDFLYSDGEKDFRDHDAEFENAASMRMNFLSSGSVVGSAGFCHLIL